MYRMMCIEIRKIFRVKNFKMIFSEFIQLSMESTICPVCFDLVTEPISLSCGHAMCWPCLVQNRRSSLATSKLCPHSLCEYTSATPLYLSGKPVISKVSHINLTNWYLFKHQTQ